MRPEAVVATTFTRQAAAQLQNRARTRLLQEGRAREAQALLTARIGTVNAVCGGLVEDYALPLGLSPELRVLDEAAAEAALQRALAATTSDSESEALQSFRDRFDQHFDWHYEVRRLIESARANDINPETMIECGERSIRSLDDTLGDPAADAAALERPLADAIGQALEQIDARGDTTKGTAEYKQLLERSARDLRADRLGWRGWAALTIKEPRKRCLDLCLPIRTAAARHIEHPRLRVDLRQLIELIFTVGARGLAQYQKMKRAQGLIDFVDQEVFALELLSRTDLSPAIAEELDLVLIDEFQDTSPLQLAIFLKLATLAKQSMWVGDPKQAIFGFRGTDPSLMDAAIESLSDPTRDPELIERAVDTLAASDNGDALRVSYRSRPALVAVSNAVFVPAFAAQQGMSADRVQVSAHRREADELVPPLAQWSLVRAKNGVERAAAVAAGVRGLLSDPPMVWDRASDENRPARAGDIGILCRTNAQCRQVSEQLGRLAIAAVVARVGLHASAEGQVLVAGLRLVVDPRDTLAAAILSRILDYPQDGPAFLQRVLEKGADGLPKRDAFASSQAVMAILAACETHGDLGILSAIDVVVDAVDLRRLTAAWGNPAQRTANIDAFRAHAARYANQRRVGGDAPNLVGFLAFFDDLAMEDWWGRPTRADTVARIGDEDAVTVSTWHAAKGLEWPVVVLFGLEALRPPEAHGVHVLSDRTVFDIEDPLGGRYLHFWPSPYVNASQNGPVKDAYRASGEYRDIAAKAEKEALRVLYVGWTRARDGIVLAARQGSMLKGLLRTLSAIDEGLITEVAAAEAPVGGAADTDDAASTLESQTVEVEWGGHRFSLQVTTCHPEPPVPPLSEELRVRIGRPPAEHPPATLAPSAALPRPTSIADPIEIGDPIRPTATFSEPVMGEAVHAFLAADAAAHATAQATASGHEANRRRGVATALLNRYGLGDALGADALVEMGDRLWGWVATSFGEGAEMVSEAPVAQRLLDGTQVMGDCDLLVMTLGHIGIVDHKIFGLDKAKEIANELGGQLGRYASIVAATHPAEAASIWIHLPFSGVVAALALDD